jgi:hypothetical protein
MTESSSLLEKAVERILEMSADLQIKRCATTKCSLAYHDLSVAIAAHGDVLCVLTMLQEQEQEQYSCTLGLLNSLHAAPESRAVA